MNNKEPKHYSFLTHVFNRSSKDCIEVEAEASAACEHLILTKPVYGIEEPYEVGNGWKITHVNTRKAVTEVINSLQVARKVMAVYDKLPLDWDTVTEDNANERYAKFAAAFPEFEKWRMEYWR
jgi:hypothetical protein